MAATMASMQSTLVGASIRPGVSSDVQALRGGIVRLPLARRAPVFRCQASENDGASPSALREKVDQATKREITKEDVLRHQEEEQSEKQSVFGAVPKSGSFYPRPEVERRPETGDRSYQSLMAFDGAAPETINGRLAMLGMVWAFVAEKATGLTVVQQLFLPGFPGLIMFVATVQLFAYASMVPMLQGESPDSRSWGPFNAKAERWNGRLAMIGFASLLIDEMVRGSAVFH